MKSGFFPWSALEAFENLDSQYKCIDIFRMKIVPNELFPQLC